MNAFCTFSYSSLAFTMRRYRSRREEGSGRPGQIRYDLVAKSPKIDRPLTPPPPHVHVWGGFLWGGGGREILSGFEDLGLLFKFNYFASFFFSCLRNSFSIFLYVRDITFLYFYDTKHIKQRLIIFDI